MSLQTDQRPGCECFQLYEVWQRPSQAAQNESQLLHPGGAAAGVLQVKESIFEKNIDDNSAVHHFKLQTRKTFFMNTE